MRRCAFVPIVALAAIIGLSGSGRGAEPVRVPEVGRLTGFPDWVVSVAYSPDGRLLAAGSYETVQIWSGDGKELKKTLRVRSGYARDVAFSPDGSRLAVGAYRAAVLFDTANWETKHRLTGHTGYVTGVAFSPDGKWLATSSDDLSVRIWNTADGTPGRALPKQDYPVTDVAWSPDGKWLATTAGDVDRVTVPGQVRVWDAATGEPKIEFPDHERAATAVAFSPDSHYLASGGEDEKVNVGDLATGKSLGYFGGHSRPTNCVLFAPGGVTLISGSGGRAKGMDEVKIWNRDDGSEYATIAGHEGRVNAIALSPNGKTLATASHDKTVALWNVGPVLAAAGAVVAVADEPEEGQPRKELRVGIIGLDTSHAIAFTNLLNAKMPNPEFVGCRVVAAYPKGSPDIRSSVERVPKYTADVESKGVEIVESIDALLEKVDAVLLETNDGRPHLEQVIPCLKAGKPVFIDKPVAGSLSDAIAIYELAKKHKVPIFSASSLRYAPGAQALRNGKIGPILGCDAYSPCSLEPTHPDLFWYGIHGVETLFTVMGPGCRSVARTSTPDYELAVGTWDDGRVGTFRGIRKGKSGYGGTAFSAKAIEPVGPYGGYEPLLVEIVKFFRTGQPPVSPEETLEIYTFMEAADESKRQKGAPVMLQGVREKATQEAQKTLADLEK